MRRGTRVTTTRRSVGSCGTPLPLSARGPAHQQIAQFAGVPTADLEFDGVDEDAHGARVQAEFADVAQGDEMAPVDADEAT